MKKYNHKVANKSKLLWLVSVMMSCSITLVLINCFYMTSLLPDSLPIVERHTLVTIPKKKQRYMEKQYSIPRELLFIDTRYNKISEMPKHVVENVNRTIRLFRNLWNDTDAPVNFLGNKQCLDAINASKSDLIPYYQTEPKGMYKSDICRAAILYLTGGYYFDNDMQIIHALSLPNNITYSTAMEFGDKGHFVSFVFTMKGHPILNNTLELMADYYQGRKNITNQLGPTLFKEAYDSQPMRIKAASKILRETRLEREPRYRNVPKLKGVGCCCNFVVEDIQAKQIVFYSRMVGAGVNCDFPKSGNRHSSQSASVVHISAQKEKHPFTFIHIPKTGGSSIEVAGAKNGLAWSVCLWQPKIWAANVPCPKQTRLLRAERGNNYGDASPWHLPPSYFKSIDLTPYESPHPTTIFTVVRNPYDRAVSEFNYQNLKDKYINEAAIMNQILTVRLEQFQKATKGSKDYFMYDCHFIPQTDYLYGMKGQKLNVRVLRFETLKEDFAKLVKDFNLPSSMNNILKDFRTNASPQSITSADLTPHTRALIETVYAHDFQEFGYPLHKDET